MPSFRHQPATSQREETWAQPTALATPRRCWLHLPFPGLRGKNAPCSRVACCPSVTRALYYPRTDVKSVTAGGANRISVRRCRELLRVPTVCEKSTPHGRRHNGDGHSRTLPALCLNPPASLECKGECQPSYWGELMLRAARCGTAGWIRVAKAGQGPGSPFMGLGNLKAREPRLQKTEAEGLASGQCARRGNSKPKGRLLHLGSAFSPFSQTES